MGWVPHRNARRSRIVLFFADMSACGQLYFCHRQPHVRAVRTAVMRGYIILSVLRRGWLLLRLRGDGYFLGNSIVYTYP